MKKNKRSNSPTKNMLSRYIKFSDKYFTFYLRDPYKTNTINKIFKYIAFFSNLIFGFAGFFLSAYKERDIEYRIIGSLLIVIPNMILYLLYKCIKSIKENIFRIDILYTSDFDRIFIGLVKYTETSYVNTFEFKINNINRFILDRIGPGNNNLIVIFKNNESQLICNLKKYLFDLEGLTYILNERLINDKNNVNEINTINTVTNENNQI